MKARLATNYTDATPIQDTALYKDVVVRWYMCEHTDVVTLGDLIRDLRSVGGCFEHLSGAAANDTPVSVKHGDVTEAVILGDAMLRAYFAQYFDFSKIREWSIRTIVWGTRSS